MFHVQIKKTAVEWISATDSLPWISNPLIELIELTDLLADITINSRSTQQVIDGFGGCFNELGREALNLLKNEEKKPYSKIYLIPFRDENLIFAACQ